MLSSIAKRSGNFSPDGLVASNEDANGCGGGETTAWECEPESEPDQAPEREQQEEEDAIAEVVDEGSAPRWLLRVYGLPVVRGHVLTDPEFDSLRIVVRIRACTRPTAASLRASPAAGFSSAAVSMFLATMCGPALTLCSLRAEQTWWCSRWIGPCNVGSF